MPSVSGLEILGRHPEACGIEATLTMQLVLRGLNIRETLHAVRLYVRNRNVIISDCHIYQNRGVGIFLDDCNLHQINITGCHISYNEAGGIVVRAGDVRNIQVTGCDIEGNMPLDPVVAQKAPPTANILIDNTGAAGGTAEIAITGCTIQHTHQANDSANIRYIGRDGKNRVWGHVVIANNVLSDAQFNIDLLQARGVSIVGNTFWHGVQYNLRAVDCSHLVIGPNVLDRNLEYEAQADAAEGVLLRSCTDCTIAGLHISGTRRNPAGLVLQQSRRIHISGSTVLDCENAGIMLDQCTDCYLHGCLLRPKDGDTTGWVPVREIEGQNNQIELRPQSGG